ncbi:disease resistance protein RGA2-like [Typha angustifolia]|uniref:disease resistance protein RGA2-like n=1 Tax=Typha angustifolia TaxID=59011 RepID=UPI003C2E9A3D
MAVELVVGGWFASSIVSNLITSLISYVKEDQSKRQLGLKAELKRLHKALPKIQAVMSTVDSGHIKEENPELASWLWQFRDAVDEAEDFIDEMDYYQLEEEIKGKKSKVSHAASRLKTIFERAVRKDTTLERLKNIVKGLDEVAADVGHFVHLVGKLKHKQPSNTSNRDTSSLLPVEHKVVGRDDEKDNLINKLLSFSSASVGRNFSILPIVGVGGIGKTTLAQFVYNDERIEKHFSPRIWVCVSNNFDVLSLTKKIYESLKLHQNHTINNLDLLQREILESLKSKKILLVLDDVWNDDDRESWGKLLAPFSSVEGGSMVLLTTRMEKITKMMTGTMEPIFLRGLSEENYWDFFKNCAFGGEDPKNYNKLQDIGKKIVKKLKGSPLAAKTVGGILRNNLDDEHWEDILNSEIWELEQSQNDIVPALRLSYQHLSSHLKPCFRFCSIFPQDYSFDKEKIIYMWMVLGLVQKPMKGNRRPEDIGHEYFDDLVKKSFFDKMDCPIERYVMHDLLHELAEFVSQGECFRIDESSGPKSIPTSIRHLSISNSVALPIPEIIKLKNLRTLLINSDSSEDDILNVLKGLKSLCILVVRNFNIIDDCISSLIHLRYLVIHDISHVPKSVNKLYHLQFLYYHYIFDPDFSDIPADSIDNLINLRILSTPNTRCGKTSGIGRLTSLRILERFIVAVNGNNFLELKNLRELRELVIESLKNVSRVEDICEANLKEKVHIQKLTLIWTEIFDDCSRSPEVDEQVLDNIEPHYNLKKLIIRCYVGRRSPHWMSPQSLSKLVSIQLENCAGWEDLSPLGQLPYLESLQLGNMRSLKSVGIAPDRGTEVCVFPSLKKLRIKFMSALEEFYGGATQWLPCLKTLDVFYCPKLRVFPNLPCGLSKLFIDNVSWVTLPQLWHDQGEASSSSSSLSSLKIHSCGDLVSLAEGLLLHPQLFTFLVELDIDNCSELTHLPIGGFGKFTSLKELTVEGCRKLRNDSTSGRFLPSSLHYLAIDDCYALDPLPNKAPQDLDFLTEVIISGCANIKSLPSAEVLGRWKALERLWIEDCSQLESLGDLQALPSLKYLMVKECPNLVAKSSLSTSLAEHPSASTSLILDEIHIDDLSLLCTMPLKSISTRELHLECCIEFQSSALEEWALKNRTLLQALYIRDVSSWQFLLEELQSLCCLQVLLVYHCRELQSLPKLPSSLKEMRLYDCPPELEERCLQDLGPDWPKIQHIPTVQIGNYDKETLAAITLEEHNRRTRV